MSISIQVRVDNQLAAMLARVQRDVQSRRAILSALGAQLRSLTVRAFDDPSLRPSPWAPRVEGQGDHPLLKKSGRLWHSISAPVVTDSSVTVSSDAKYAALQQFGGVIRPVKARALVFQLGGKTVRAQKVTIPARPYFPVTPDGQFTALAQARLAEAGEKKLAALLKA